MPAVGRREGGDGRIRRQLTYPKNRPGGPTEERPAQAGVRGRPQPRVQARLADVPEARPRTLTRATLATRQKPGSDLAESSRPPTGPNRPVQRNGDYSGLALGGRTRAPPPDLVRTTVGKHTSPRPSGQVAPTAFARTRRPFTRRESAAGQVSSPTAQAPPRPVGRRPRSWWAAGGSFSWPGPSAGPGPVWAGSRWPRGEGTPHPAGPARRPDRQNITEVGGPGGPPWRRFGRAGLSGHCCVWEGPLDCRTTCAVSGSSMSLNRMPVFQPIARR